MFSSLIIIPESGREDLHQRLWEYPLSLIQELARPSDLSEAHDTGWCEEDEGVNEVGEGVCEGSGDAAAEGVADDGEGVCACPW